MIWVWPAITIILFYFFALLQNSFFIYFSFFGAIPNFIFIFFFISIFFSKKDSYYKAIFFGFLAGFFLDIFSAAQIGVSIFLLLIIGLCIKKIKGLLKQNEDNYPFLQFISLFLISFVAYSLVFDIILYLLHQEYASINLNFKFLAEVIYSLFFAVIGFFVCKISNLFKNV